MAPCVSAGALFGLSLPVGDAKNVMTGTEYESLSTKQRQALSYDLRRKSNAALQKKDYKNAVECLRQARIAFDDPAIRQQIIHTLYEAHRYVEALEQVSIFIKLNTAQTPGDRERRADIIWIGGLCAFELQGVDYALNFLTMQRAPALVKGRVLVHEGEYKRAALLLAKSTEKTATRREELLLAAMAYLRCGNPEAARVQALLANRIKTSSISASLLLAACKACKNKEGIDKAIALWEKQTNLTPEDKRIIIVERGRQALESNQALDALKHLEAACKLKPDVDTLNCMALAHNKLKNYQQAAAYALKAYQMDTRNKATLYNYAENLALSGKLEDANTLFCQLIEVPELQEGALLNRSAIYLLNGERGKAEADLAQLKQRFPSKYSMNTIRRFGLRYVRGFDSLASVFSSPAGRTTEAKLSELQRDLKSGKAQGNADFYTRRARLELELNQFKSALEDSDRAISLGGTLLSHETRAAALWALGQGDQALKERRKVITLFACRKEPSTSAGQ